MGCSVLRAHKTLSRSLPLKNFPFKGTKCCLGKFNLKTRQGNAGRFRAGLPLRLQSCYLSNACFVQLIVADHFAFEDLSS